LRFWTKLGFISFGGPTGQIAIMQTELVDRRRWISPTHFLHALNYSMLLPGELVFEQAWQRPARRPAFGDEIGGLSPVRI
jgi:chromate transport protein ChrA